MSNELSQREKDIQEMCKQVLELSAECYESGGGTGYTKCPLCHEEVRKWQGGMCHIEHAPNCAWIIAKDLSTGYR